MELEQMLHSGHKIRSHTLTYTGEQFIESIAGVVQILRNDFMDLTSNSGEHEFVNDTFALRSYCYRCPPNFEFFDLHLKVYWQERIGKNATTNIPVTDKEWVDILAACIRSLE